MYFPGTTQQQIDNLVTRVAALENPQTGTDQNEYQNYSNLSKTATGYSLGSSITSGLAQALQQQAQADLDAANEAKIASTSKTKVYTGSYTPGFYIVKFLDGSDAAEIVADSFYFESGFVVFTRNSNDQAVASYPAHAVGSIKL